jgi:ribosomal protein S18 acetylase RimI-like enzyme
MAIIIRDARPSDAPFLAECILAWMHLYDFEEVVNDDLTDALENITQSEGREDTLYTYSRTRIAEVDGKPAGALLSYPGALYKDLKEKTLKEYWPAFFTLYGNDEPETDPGEFYLDSLAVHPDFRRLGIGRALLEDGIKIGLSKGFTQIALVADAGMPHLIKIYQSIGFVPADHRNVFGTDFLRMIYTI